MTLTSDTDLTAGLDIDGDLDPDVFDPGVEGLEVCADVDGDGDIEFPAGFYRACTILDADVFFNQLPIWTIGEAEIDADPLRVDLRAVAMHEFGHSHGLAHSLINQIDGQDGTGATMFPFLFASDPDSERGQRSLAIDDVAWSSFLYPEGTASTGPAVLGPSDLAFDQVFGVITGEVTQGEKGLPLAGGAVFAVDRDTGAFTAISTASASVRWAGSGRSSFPPASSWPSSIRAF